MFNAIKEWFRNRKVNEVAEHFSSAPEKPFDPKEAATENKEPWVAVINTHVNPENPRNGFFELDWNEYFIEMLRNTGYTGVKDEELVDAWFQDLCREVGNEEGVMMDRRFSGYVDVSNLGNGRSAIG